MKEEKLYNAFKMFDLDGSGKISADELKKTLGCKDLLFFLFIYKFVKMVLNIKFSIK